MRRPQRADPAAAVVEFLTAVLMRLVDEEISLAVVSDGVHVSSEEATARIVSAIRAGATLPICDAVA